MAETGAQELSIVQRLSRLVEENEVGMPAYPDVALRVHEMLESEDATAKAAAELIANDPALTAEVLKIANSAAYGGLSEIADLRTAVARLGLSQTASIVTALTMRPQFDSGGAQRKTLMWALWNHAVATAIAARFLAQKLGGAGEQAFLAGLLHDTGKLLVIRGVDLLREQGTDVPETRTMLDELMVQLHPQLGHVALKAWNLPDELARVALHHHDTVEDGDDLLMLCVQAGNLISRKSGFHPSPDPGLPLLQEPPIEMLGLMDVSLASLMIDVEDELQKKQQIFC